MPTYDRTPEFLRDLERLTPEQRLAFNAAVGEMVQDLKAHHPFRSSLRVELKAST